MVEQDAVDREHAVGLAVVAGHPVAVDLRRVVGAARVERGVLVLRGRGRAEHLRTAARLVEAAVEPDHPDDLQQAGRAPPGGVAGVLRLVEADPNVALCAQVVHLVGRDAAEQGH